MYYKTLDEYFLHNGMATVSDVQTAVNRGFKLHWEAILLVRSRLNRSIDDLSPENFTSVMANIAAETPEAVVFMEQGPCEIKLDFENNYIRAVAVQHEEGIEVPYNGTILVVFADDHGNWVCSSDPKGFFPGQSGDSIYIVGYLTFLTEPKAKVINLRNYRKLKM